jgi:hypothetical protein
MANHIHVHLHRSRDEEYVQPPRMAMVWDVLERAKDAGDARIVAACRRIINADRLGWKKHGDPNDLKLVREFNE